MVRPSCFIVFHNSYILAIASTYSVLLHGIKINGINCFDFDFSADSRTISHQSLPPPLFSRLETSPEASLAQRRRGTLQKTRRRARNETNIGIWSCAAAALLISPFNERCKPADRFLIFHTMVRPGWARGGGGGPSTATNVEVFSFILGSTDVITKYIFHIWKQMQADPSTNSTYIHKYNISIHIYTQTNTHTRSLT